jgi:hypothetical protein
VSEYSGFFVFQQALLTANRFKYAYGRKVTEDKYKNDVVKLPIKRNKDMSPYKDKTQRYSKNGYVPDWDFMDRFMTTLPYGDRISY